jgi:hypothetical protein
MGGRQNDFMESEPLLPKHGGYHYGPRMTRAERSWSPGDAPPRTRWRLGCMKCMDGIDKMD